MYIRVELSVNLKTYPFYLPSHLLWKTILFHIPAMYSDITMLAQASSSVHCPIFNLTRSDGNADYPFLDKRCTTLNHCAFDFSSKHLDDKAWPLKKQKLALYVNTRHHSNASALSIQVSMIYWQKTNKLIKYII